MIRFSKTALMATALAAGIASPSLAATLSEPAQSALLAALDDEYRAEAFYAAVIDKFGAVRPFSNIINAERRHSDMVGDLMAEYGVEQPENKYLGAPETVASVPATLAEACQMGVEAEILNRDLYDKELMPATADYPDIVVVMQRLRDASETKHLPAFRRCS